MSTLSERYIWAVTRSIPEKQRTEIEPELAELIADSVEAQIESGTPEATAEHAALVQLGDPTRLASRYTGSPLHLIGPNYYPQWLRLLKTLAAIVLPIAAIAVGIGSFLSTHDVGEAIGSAVAVTISVAVHLAFWTTLVFALVERSEQRSGTKTSSMKFAEWTPEMLPQTPANKQSRAALSEMVASLAFLALFIGWIFWQHFASPLTDAGGEPIPVFNPALGLLWALWFVAILVLEMVFAVWLYQRGRWTFTLATANLALNLAFAIPGLWLLTTGQLINPEFVSTILKISNLEGDATLSNVMTAFVPIIGVTVVAFAVWDVVAGYVKAWQAR